METYTFEDIKDEVYGAKGTSRRDNIEKELATQQVGLQIRNARKALHMIQSPPHTNQTVSDGILW